VRFIKNCLPGTTVGLLGPDLHIPSHADSVGVAPVFRDRSHFPPEIHRRQLNGGMEITGLSLAAGDNPYGSGADPVKM